MAEAPSETLAGKQAVLDALPDHPERIRLKTWVDSSDPAIESITSVWPGANYYEREVFDLFGIRFEGHPNLRRILMPDDWVGYPLRKDYPVEGYR
jgi:NADH-quinone oxidoreductase subunit C